ncbi:zinc-binding alcohol dehydrogenase family protein [Methylobacterium frigidaeris]|uniref:Zinc-type alcohol dehydrogenase-like protein n=1 Tax=Methylobacterium frigidaeris TaxID=2038277 RepID=A0AA37HJN2_9HYPH|nr:zinc-binding alcohol dehydrogenase family protein [Methylobacterium frigidaeris]GJD66988.1 Zinc-type alcohol dehydrogenase-like protein [Methylobacterium frigidaeris]
MRAVTYTEGSSIDAPDALVDTTFLDPAPTGRDLLVRVQAVSVNPIDTKVRQGAYKQACEPKILGWDAAGTVISVGPEARLFKPGDAVFYAGTLNRPGSNAELQCVDERLVGPKPESLDFAAAAALPLTAVTAWEMLFDRLDVAKPVPGAAPAILIVGGAGGVGSIAIQLARQLTDLTVIATASRSETAQWCRDLGAHHVVNHGRPLATEVAALGLGEPGFVFATTGTSAHLPEIIELLAPQGRLGPIDDPATLDVMPLKLKSLSLHWELMFTRSLFRTADMERQHTILTEVSRLIDEGKLRTTLSETFGPINAGNLTRAHALIERGRAKGKVVLEGFGE